MPQEVSAPVSTYRLQFNKDFGLCAATKLLDYFSSLGITDIYASPILASRKGSSHGYDVIDPTRLDPDFGSEEDFEIFQDELVKRGMGLLLDIVPNHMAASSENRWWMDVLENGAQSAFASYFDINWNPPSRSLTGKVFLPVLAQPFGDALDQGQIHLTFEAGKFFVKYFDSIFPVAPETYHLVLDFQSIPEIGRGQEAPEFQELSGILSGFAAVPGDTIAHGAAVARPKFTALCDRLRIIVEEQPRIAAMLQSKLGQFNGTSKRPGSFRELERLLNRQNYVLAYWQDPNEGINYRRFFAISDLVGVRVDDPIVFEATHEYIFRLLAKCFNKGMRIGVRVDHIDGLRDPASYLARLRQRISEIPGAPATPYIVAEKILGATENLPADWPVSGTTGYDYLNAQNELSVSQVGLAKIQETFAKFVGRKAKFRDVVFESKKRVMDSLLRVEVRGLARELAELAAKDRYARSIPRRELMESLSTVTACMPVYRTYIRTLDVPPDAKATIELALHAARERCPDLSETSFDFLRDVLTLAHPAHISPEQQEDRLAFVMRWQQFTGPIFAKGFEDTALYVYFPLSSLNEVGGNPEGFGGDSRDRFSGYLRERSGRWPHSLNATMTHDTKRGEDVRARINVLSEIPEEWAANLDEWAKLNASNKQPVNGRKVPDAEEEYLIYQTLIGMWPADVGDSSAAQVVSERLQKYMVKAIREAAVHTKWIQPDENHEQALTQFIREILSNSDKNEFLRELIRFHSRVAWPAAINGLAQTLLKIVSPGVPDFYQGSEFWDFRLVDPENREPVDYATRREALQAISNLKSNTEATIDLMKGWRDGTAKLFAAKKALEYRRAHQDLFMSGDFLQLKVQGPKSETVIPIFRHNARDQAIAIVPRWITDGVTNDGALPAKNYWRDTSILLPDIAFNNWINIFTGELFHSPPGHDRSIPVHDAIANFPVALLVPVSSS